jgi:homoserine O-acetyltransferase/O-succinyltransferase
MDTSGAHSRVPENAVKELFETQTVILYTQENPLRLERGAILSPVTVAYQTYGTLNEEGTNAILVCHALTGNAHAAGQARADDLSYTGSDNPLPRKNGKPANVHTGWWDGMIGSGKAFDTDRYFVICSNFIGSCYGTTGPTGINPDTGVRYGPDFPFVTVRDMVTVQKALLDRIGVRRLVTVSGGSLGGMQALEWVLMYPDFVDSVIPIATSIRHSDWAIGLNETARLAIKNDPAWRNGYYTEQPARGLALARMIAMISYRSRQSFGTRFNRESTSRIDPAKDLFADREQIFQIESYLRYQGKKLVNRFDANTYITISHAMDAHDVTTGRGKPDDVLGSISVPVLCVGISSDVLYPAQEQREIASLIPESRYTEIDSPHGHDAFLIEFDQVNRAVHNFLEKFRP